MAASQSKEKPFQCRYCPRKMRTQKESLRHEATHAENTGNNFDHVDTDIDSKPKEDPVKPAAEVVTVKDEIKNQKTCSENTTQVKSNDAVATQATGISDDVTETREEIFCKAALYDETKKKCEELEKEIAELQLKHNITDAEIDAVVLEMETEETAVKCIPAASASVVNDIDNIDKPLSETDIKWDSATRTIPKGWRIGSCKEEKRKVFRSPEGFLFRGRVKALQFMMKNRSQYPENLLSLMRNNLAEEQWTNDKSCPLRWKARRLPGWGTGGFRELEYLHPVTLEVVPSIQQMLEFVQSNDKEFTKKDVKKLEDRIADLKAETAPKSKSSSEKVKAPAMEPPPPVEEFLPPGWVKKRIGNSAVYISPSGETVPTIQQVLTEVELTKKKKELSDALDMKKIPEAPKSKVPQTSNRKMPQTPRPKNQPNPKSTVKSTLEVKIEPNSKPSDQESAQTNGPLTPKPTEKRKIEQENVNNKKGRTDESCSSSQIKILEDHYKTVEKYPKKEKIKEIAAAAKMEEKQVQMWFMRKSFDNAESKAKECPTPAKASMPPPAPVEKFPSLTEVQISSLEDIMTKRPYPSTENFQQMSTKLGIDKEVIVKWFRKRRIEKQQEEEKRKSDEKRAEELKSTLNANNVKTEPKSDKKDYTERQEKALKKFWIGNKTPNTRQYRTLMKSTSLSRTMLEKWFKDQNHEK